jgi:hypothetical protein
MVTPGPLLADASKVAHWRMDFSSAAGSIRINACVFATWPIYEPGVDSGAM